MGYFYRKGMCNDNINSKLTKQISFFSGRGQVERVLPTPQHQRWMRMEGQYSSLVVCLMRLSNQLIDQLLMPNMHSIKGTNGQPGILVTDTAERGNLLHHEVSNS